MGNILDIHDEHEFIAALTQGDFSSVGSIRDRIVARCKILNLTTTPDEVLMELVSATLPVHDTAEVDLFCSDIKRSIADVTPVSGDPIDVVEPVEPVNPVEIFNDHKFYQDICALAEDFNLRVDRLDQIVFPADPVRSKPAKTNDKEPDPNRKPRKLVKAITKLRELLILLDEQGVDLRSASLSIGKPPQYSRRVYPYTILSIPSIDTAVCISDREGTYLIKGLNDLMQVVDLDKEKLLAVYPNRVRKVLYDHENPNIYLRRIYLKINSAELSAASLKKLRDKYPTRELFMDMSYSDKTTARFEALTLDELGYIVSDSNVILTPSRSVIEQSIMADIIYPESLAEDKVHPEKLTAVEWMKELKTHFTSDPVDFMQRKHRQDIIIHSWNLDQIAVAIISKADRSTHLKKGEPFTPIKIDKHLAILGRILFGTKVDEIEVFFWDTAQLVKHIKSKFPNRTHFENMKSEAKKSFKILGKSLFTLYNSILGKRGRPEDNKVHLTELLDRIYS
jgi:hypothetical protein